MILYHGSYLEISQPDLAHSRDAVDFGKGFYLTPIESQAKKWCVKHSRRWADMVVTRYNLADESLAQLKVLKFDAYSEDWLDFIVSCRAKEDVSDWDVVIGGVANDKVFDTLELFFDGLATKAQTIDRLRFEEPNLQVCLRTQAAIAALKFLDSEKL